MTGSCVAQYPTTGSVIKWTLKQIPLRRDLLKEFSFLENHFFCCQKGPPSLQKLAISHQQEECSITQWPLKSVGYPCNAKVYMVTLLQLLSTLAYIEVINMGPTSDNSQFTYRVYIFIKVSGGLHLAIVLICLTSMQRYGAGFTLLHFHPSRMP